MATYTYAIEASDDGRIWMPEADAIGTEDSDGTAAQFALDILRSRLADGTETGPADGLRVVVWPGTEQDTVTMAAAIADEALLALVPGGEDSPVRYEGVLPYADCERTGEVRAITPDASGGSIITVEFDCGHVQEIPAGELAPRAAE